MDLRGDVQQFLTGMRARLTPEQAGVPMFGGERRVPGLRREEVAQLAGVSTAYYTRLERLHAARTREPPRRLRERAPVTRPDPADDRGGDPAPLRPGASGLGRHTDPACEAPVALAAASRAADRRHARRPSGRARTPPDVVGANTLGRALFPHLFPENGEPLNHTRHLFLDDRSRDFYIDWEH